MVSLLFILIFICPFISSLAFPYLRLIYSLILLSLLLFWIILRGFPKERIKAIQYPFFLFCFALIISVSLSVNKLSSLIEFYKYIIYLLVFLISLSLADKQRAKLISTIIFSSFIISVLAIYQYFFGFQHLINYIDIKRITDPFVIDYITNRRVFFPFVTPNALAGFLIIAMPLILTIKKRESGLFFYLY